MDPAEIRPLLQAYARWGVHYVIFYDRPNMRAAWQSKNWVQPDPVKNFIDHFLPLAALAVEFGLTPVFPPLEPGGSYWDTAFLRAALQELIRRKQDAVLRSLALSAYGWTWNHPLDWGAGGPECWPQARPYHNDEGSQDQRGFHIFDWYQAISQSVLQRASLIFLLQAGLPGDPSLQAAGSAQDVSVATVTSIAGMLTAGAEPAAENQPAGGQNLPAQVAAGCFWLLASEAGSPYARNAWYTLLPDRAGQPVESTMAAAVSDWQASRLKAGGAKGIQKGSSYSIKHYLLLPGYDWGVSDWYLEVTRPFIKKYRPTIGFSVEEAGCAAKVTVVGNVPGFTREALAQLKQNGCEVEWIDGDGMKIATQLAER